MNKGVPTRVISLLTRNQNPIGGVLRPQSGVLGYSANVSATGGNTTTTINNVVYHKFTATGTLTVLNGGNIEILMVSGGGGGGSSSWGGQGGGGGGGGALVFPVAVSALSTVSVVIGAGGAQSPYLNIGFIGGTTSVTGSFGFISVLGGSGAHSGYEPSGALGFEGGACGAGVSNPTNFYTGGGGGGMSTNGSDGQGTPFSGASTTSVLYGRFGGQAGDNATGMGGNGGNGIVIWENTYCGGGGGGAENNATSSSGGTGGGGNGGRISSRAGTAGTINTGGGGGGGSWTGVVPPTSQDTANGGLGGSGVVFVRYSV